MQDSDASKTCLSPKDAHMLLISTSATVNFNPPRPREGGGGVGATLPPRRFFRDYSEHVIDRELKLGIADP